MNLGGNDVRIAAHILVTFGHFQIFCSMKDIFNERKYVVF